MKADLADGLPQLDFSATKPSFPANGVTQLITGIVAMVAITNLQYGWTFFVGPLEDTFGWTRKAIQVAFTLFILAETWLVPFEGYVVDRLGPRLPVAVGGLLVGLAWVVDAHATSLWELYAGGIIGGTGAGVVYGASIGNALKWFSHRRGLAAGLTSAAFGAGSALTVVPMIATIKNYGYDKAFLWFGLVQGGLVLVCALTMRAPRLDHRPALLETKSPDPEEPFPGNGAGSDALRPAEQVGGTTTVGESSFPVPPVPSAAAGLPNLRQPGRDYSWREMLRTPAFWLMYVMMVLVSIGGLTMTAELATMASRDFGVADVPVTLLGVTMAALPFAASIDRVLNGLTRPFFGWVSDHLGRENTMFVAFALEGTAIFLFIAYAHIPVMFVLLTGLVYFAWGEIYSLFPALCGDLFGRKFATTNYGVMYTAKGTASLLIPVAAWWRAVEGSWTPVLLAFSAFAWIVALAALLVLKPLRVRMQNR